MCGILGAVTTAGGERRLEVALERLRHRGPDDRGIVRCDVAGRSVALGHTRLSIVDLSSAGHQPMACKDGRWVITYNGEIYNHLDLRKELAGPWYGHSDTETLVEALSKWGLHATLPRLEGIFAFGALDTVERKLYLVRDPFGVKPIYYQRLGTALHFASEIRPLQELSGTRPGLDTDALQTFLALRYCPSPQTLLAGIMRVPAGHYIAYELSSGACGSHCYVRRGVQSGPASIEAAVDKYEEALISAVKAQMLSDVPVGIFLSGGIDSALIAAIVKRLGYELPCFTVGFGPQHEECEIADGAHTARALRFPHRAIEVTPEQLWDALDPSVRAIEEPLGTTSVLPMWYLAREARREVTVVLAGQGNDEPWGGYFRYQGELLWPYIPFRAALANTVRGLNKMRALPDVIVRGAASARWRDDAKRFECAYELFTEDERLRLTGRPDSGHAPEAISTWLAWAGQKQTTAVEKMMAIDTRMNLSDDLLLYGDKITMAHSIEARVPYLDAPLVALVESLPRAAKLSFRRTKIVHRALARRFLPSEIIDRPKRGFQVPVGNWLRTSWRARTEHVLLDRDSPYLSVINRHAVEHIWWQHQHGRIDRSRQLFALMTLATWWRHWCPDAA